MAQTLPKDAHKKLIKLKKDSVLLIGSSLFRCSESDNLLTKHTKTLTLFVTGSA